MAMTKKTFIMGELPRGSEPVADMLFAVAAGCERQMKRYSDEGYEMGVEEDPNGEYVKFADVAVIVAENDDLKIRVELLKKANQSLFDRNVQLEAYAKKVASGDH
jgi:hypothetical protein